MITTPRLLEHTKIAAIGRGWYLIRGGSCWLPVAGYPPSPAADGRCWWIPDPPPRDGWRRPASR